MKDDKEKPGIKWDELVFGTIEKLASAPSKLKDPKESVAQAFEWVKGLRDDVQEKITQELMDRIRQLDWDALAKKVADHLVENYEIEVSSKVSFKPKANRKKAHGQKSKRDEEASSEEKSGE